MGLSRRQLKFTASAAWRIVENVDSAPPQPANLSPPISSSGSQERVPQVNALQPPEAYLTETLDRIIDELWQVAEAVGVDLTKPELSQIFLAIGAKYNYGLAPGVRVTGPQAGAFWRALQLRELALAQACAMGRDIAWRQFLDRYREPLTQAAIAMTGSASLGRELADSLYSEMFGLSSRDGQRRSPLASYAGRGSLLGFLRTTLAQRHVDHHRRTHRETTLEGKDFASLSQLPVPASEVIARLGQSLTVTLRSLEPEARLLLSAWFLDQRTLLEIAQVLQVHEATVSRQLKRLTARLQKELLKNLHATGMSKHAAQEALGTDPRDLAINIRSLLQTSQPATFLQQRARLDSE
jgi:RNA polymerase sigma-70 factor (ECF subfamily)